RANGQSRVGGNKSTVGVPQCDDLCTRQIRNRRNGADVESADVVLAAEIGALKGRRHHAVKSGDKRTLHVVTEGVAPFLHREELFERDDGTYRVDRPAQSGKLSANKEALTVVWGVGRVQRVHREAGDDLAGRNAAERVRSADAAEVDVR